MKKFIVILLLIPQLCFAQSTLRKMRIDDGVGNDGQANVTAGNELSVLDPNIDDWDENDRAKVNPIVGQAGIAAGTGVDGATVLRATLATDVALPTGTNTIGSVKITDGTETASVNTENRLDIVQHAHPDTGAIHFHVDGLTAGTTRYILIDLSDTTNYPHVNTGYVHIDWIEAQVDSNNTGAYKINLGFLKNVDADNGDRQIVKHWSGSRTAGNQLLIFEQMLPAGWRMREENHTTSEISVDDVNYQTDVDLPSTTSPGAANTPSGDGDIVLEVVVTAGEIDVAFDIGYHSH